MEFGAVRHREVASAVVKERPAHESTSLQEVENAFLASLVEGMRCGIAAIDRRQDAEAPAR